MMAELNDRNSAGGSRRLTVRKVHLTGIGKRRFKMSLLLAAALSGIGSLSVCAVAQEVSETCPSPPADAAEQRRIAGEWFARAQDYADAGQYLESAAAFECSSTLAPHPDTVFNAARAAKLGGDAKAAVEYAERYLEMAPEGDVAEEAKQMIAELSPKIVPEESTPEGESGPKTDPDATTEPEDVPPPEEETGPDAPPEEPSIENVAGTGTDAPVVTETDPPGKRKQSPVAIAGFAALGAGGVGIAVGAVMQGLASNAWAAGNATTSYAEFKSEDDKMKRYQTGALVGLIAGGVVAGAGIAMLLVGRDKAETPVTVGIAPRGVVVEGRF